VLGVAACGAGEPRWWESDGRLIPIRYTTQLRELADAVAAALPHRGRGSTPATPARLNGLPAIAIGTLDKRGLAPRSHQSTDMVDNVDKHAIDRAVTLGLVLVDAIDAALDPEPATSDEAATPA
jgi:hypothetical protein